MRYFFLLPLLAGFLIATPTKAQHYRPFGPGRFYHYRALDAPVGQRHELFTFRVDSVYCQGTDSVFCFNRTYALHGADDMIYADNQAQRFNLFGGELVWQAVTGVARFRVPATGQALELRTRAAVGQSWAAQAGLTATVVSRELIPVLGRPDSVVSIQLSDGQSILLAQHAGVISGPTLETYFQQTYQPALPSAPRPVELAGLPEWSATGVDLRWETMWNWQPGDQFFYSDSTDFQNFSMPPTGSPDWSSRSWRQATVLTRQTSADSLVFTFREFGYGLTYSSSFWVGPSTSGWIQPWATQRVICRRDWPVLLTGTYGPGIFNSRVIVAAIRENPAVIGGLPVVLLGRMIPDAVQLTKLVPGLGVVSFLDGGGVSGIYRNSTRLIGFVKGATQWGNTSTPQPLGEHPLPAPSFVTLSPNPAAGAEAALTLFLEHSQTLALTLADMLGRTVWHQATNLPAGEQRLSVPLVELAPGLYRLRVALPDGHHQTLPLVKQ